MQIVDDSGVPWHTWALDDGLTRRLRDCAMAFHRWAPWAEIGDSVILRAKRVGGRSWAVAPMGDHEGSSIRGVAVFAFAPPGAAAIAADAYETVLRLAGDDFDRSLVVQALGRCAICLALTGDRMRAMHAATVAEAVAKLSKRKVAKAKRWRR